MINLILEQTRQNSCYYKFKNMELDNQGVISHKNKKTHSSKMGNKPEIIRKMNEEKRGRVLSSKKTKS